MVISFSKAAREKRSAERRKELAHRRNVAKALAWLEWALGFRERAVRTLAEDNMRWTQIKEWLRESFGVSFCRPPVDESGPADGQPPAV